MLPPAWNDAPGRYRINQLAFILALLNDLIAQNLPPQPDISAEKLALTQELEMSQASAHPPESAAALVPAPTLLH